MSGGTPQWRSQALGWPPLIGRDQDIETIERHVQQQRLVTLWGPGGSGKTRLALQVAHSLAGRFADGVRLIACADLQEPELLPLQVASIVGLHGHDEGGLLERSMERLRSLHLFLIIDNCEHLLEACTTLVDRVLAACPGVRMLITSREPLNLPYEQAVPVQPLTFPASGTLPPFDTLCSYGAIQLFVQRAQMAQPDFALTRENASLIITLCRLVDGLPLAIELAAARVRMLDVGELAEQLAHGNALLHGGHRLTPPRHQTLHATISWSYQLLTPAEQLLFRRLALAVGSFDLSLAAALGEGIAGDAVDLLGRLIDQSLVNVVRVEGSVRYRLLETIRHYGREQLRQGGEAESTYQRYSAWIQRLAEHAEANLHGPQQIAWLDRLEAEIEHIRTVMSWLASQGHGSDLVRLSAALLTFFEQRAHAREAKQWLEAALTRGGAGEPASEAKALYALGVLNVRLRQFELAQNNLIQAHTRYADLKDHAGVASALSYLGYIHDRQGDYDAASTCFAASLAIVPAEQLRIKAETLLRYAMTVHARGEPQQAQTLYRDCLALHRESEDVGGIALTLANLGSLLNDEEEYDQAKACLLESLQFCADLGNRNRYLLALVNLYDTAIALDHLSLPEEYLAIALSSTWAECDTWLLGLLFERLAHIALLRHQPLRAVQLFGYTVTLKHEHADQIPDVIQMQVRQMTRKSVSVAAFDTAWQAGRRMDVDEAFDFALHGNQILVDEKEGAGAAIRTLVPDATSSRITPLRIEAFGGGRVSLDSRQASISWRYSKARELLYYLLEFPQRTKGQICLALWPDVAPEQASISMRVTLLRLRRELGGAAWVIFVDSGYSFNRSLSYWYDVEQFEARFTQAQTLRTSQDAQDADETAIQLLAEACALYRGDYLADLPPHEWILQRQAELQRHYITAECRLAEAHQRQGAIQQALTHWLQVTRTDPLHERAHRAIIACYVKLGQRSHAIHHYHELKRYLRDELGVAPDPRTTTYIATLLERAPSA